MLFFFQTNNTLPSYYFIEYICEVSVACASRVKISLDGDLSMFHTQYIHTFFRGNLTRTSHAKKKKHVLDETIWASLE